MAWTLVQKSTAPGTNSSGASVAPAIATGSAAGNLLVAMITSVNDPDALSGPSGWAPVVQGVQATGGTANLWCYLDNPGGISSATFTDTASALEDSWMAEFSTSGVSGAGVDSSGTGSTASGNSCTATASSANSAGDLSVCIFQNFVFGGTWSTPSGWTLLGDDVGANGFAWSGYQLSAAAGTLSVTGHFSNVGWWAAAVATFSATGGAPAVNTGAFFSLF